MKYSLSRFQKLLGKREFSTVYREGNRWSGNSFTLFYLTTLSARVKLGITIGRKWGKAHERNRFKRVVREGFRIVYPSLPDGLILNVHPKEGYQELTSSAVQVELKRFISSCGQTQSQSTESRCYN